MRYQWLNRKERGKIRRLAAKVIKESPRKLKSKPLILVKSITGFIVNQYGKKRSSQFEAIECDTAIIVMQEIKKQTTCQTSK